MQKHIPRQQWRLVSSVGAVIVFTLGLLIATAGTARADQPAFQMPFPCGETWYASTYGGHDAIDWNAYPDDNGRAVVASASGTASLEYQPNYGGYMINIDHGGGWKTVYAHLQQNGRVSGQVSAGQVIGFVGSTGGSTAPHLHWEQTLNGIRQTPLYANGVALSPGSSADTSAPTYTSNNCNSTPANGAVVFTNGGGETYANANPSTSTWTKLSNTTDDISASGSYTAWIDGCGAAWATSNFASVTATQITPCNGAAAIAIGSQGNLVFIDSCGSAHATNTYTNPQSWVTLTGCNGAVEIAAGGGGTGRVGVINGCGALNVTVNYQTWTQIAGCGGAQEVAIGPNGTLAFINGCGALNATTNYTNASAWVAIAGCGGATQLAVGTDKRLVFADGCGSVHGTMTYDSASSWVILTGCGGAQAIAMGTGGQTAVINGCGALNVTSNFQSWMSIAPCNGATRVAVS